MSEKLKRETQSLDVASVEKVLADLQKRQAALNDRATALNGERRGLAFDAETGDAKARKRLDEIAAEEARLAGELRNVTAAIATGGARLTAARDAETKAADREVAREQRRLVKELSDVVRRLDAALEISTKESLKFDDIVNRLHSLDRDNIVTVSAVGIARIFAIRVWRTALMKTPWRRDFEPVPPGERRTFSDLVLGRVDQHGVRTPGWAERLEAAIARRLGETEHEEAV